MSSALRSINPVIRHYMRGSCHDRVAKKPQICSKYKQDSLEIHWIPGSVLSTFSFAVCRGKIFWYHLCVCDNPKLRCGWWRMGNNGGFLGYEINKSVLSSSKYALCIDLNPPAISQKSAGVPFLELWNKKIHKKALRTQQSRLEKTDKKC